MKNYPQYVNIY